MPGEETTTKLKVDLSELKKEMQDAKRAVAVANSEFQATASTMDDWSKSSDGVSAKIKQLNSNVKNQEKVLDSLEQQYAAVVAEQGKGSKAAEDLQIKINKQKTTVNNTKKELDKFENILGEVTEAEKKSAKTGKNVSEVLDEMHEEAKDAGDGFTILKGAVATFAGNLITGFVGSIKDGISNIMGLAEETREYRTELAKMETAATQAGASTDYIKDKWHDMSAVLGDEGAVSEGLNNLMAAGYSTQEQLDGITAHLEGAAIKWKDTLKFEGLADGLQETLATGAAVGPFAEMLERSGVNLEKFDKGLSKCKTGAEQQNYVLQQLSELGLADVSKAYRDSNADIIAAEKANSDYTDTLATIGEKIEPVTTSVKEGFNGILQKCLELIGDVDMEAFTAKIEEGFATLKDDVLPAIKDGFQWIIDNKDILIAGLAGIAGGFAAFKAASLINSAVSAIKAFKAANEGATISQMLLNAVMNANPLVLLVTIIATVVTAIATFIATNDDARAKFMEIWNGVCSFFTETIPNAFNTVVDFVKTNWQSILAFFINPFAGLFKYFYDNNEKFKEFVDNAIKHIKELPGKIWTWLSNAASKVGAWASDLGAKAKKTGTDFVNTIVTFFKELPGKVWSWLSNVISKVTSWASDMGSKAKTAASNFINNVINFFKELPGKVWTWLKNTVSKITSWGSEMASKGKAAAQKLLTTVVNKIKEIPGKVKSIGGDIVKGVINGIDNMTQWAIDKVKGFGESIVNGLKDFLGIHSPATEGIEIGEDTGEGVIVGIDNKIADAAESAKNLGGAILSAIRESVSGMTGVVEEESEEARKAYDAELKKIQHLRDFGVDDEETYYKKLESLRDKYLTKHSEAWISATKEIFDYENKKVQKRQTNLKRMLDREIITEKEYYKELAKIRDEFYSKNSDEWYTLDDQIFDYNKGLFDDFKNAVKDVYSSIKDYITGIFDDIEKRQNSFAQKIGNAKPYQKVIINAGENSMEYYKLNDFADEIEAAEKFNDLVNKAVSRVATSGADKSAIKSILSEIEELGNDEVGISFLNAIVSANDKDFAQYLSDYAQYIATGATTAESVIKKMVTTEAEDIKNGIRDAFGEIPSDFKKVGAESLLQFGDAFTNNLTGVLEKIREIVSTGLNDIMDVNLNDLTGDILRDIRGNVGTVAGKITTASGGSFSNRSTIINNNYVQNIQSPNPIRRIDVYRNTKNLLGLSGGN